MKLGITGHQDLGDEGSAAWVGDQISELVRERRPAAGLTSLAVGADQIFARVLEAARIPFWVVVPCAHYESAFNDPGAREEFRRLLAISAKTVLLPFDSPGEEAYLMAGQRVVDLSDLVIAVWNGAPARGKGGTADIVTYGRLHAKPVFQIDPLRRSAGMLT